MKLIFSSGFDSYVYKKGHSFIDKKFVGELQLLTLLERELGISGDFKKQKEREAEYLESLGAYLSKHKETCISKSFKNDPIGVSKELLRWRDQLCLARWDFNEGISERLDILARVEKKHTISKGISDRWLHIYELLISGASVDISEIEIFDSENNHPFIEQLFKALKEKCAVAITSTNHANTVTESNLGKVKDVLLNDKTGITLNEEDDSFTIVYFNDDIEASDFLAQQLEKNNAFRPVIINRDNTALDTSLTTFNIPKAGAEIKGSSPQLIQLFKLITSLLFEKTDPYNLLSLLKLPMLPFSKKLALKLSQVLIETSGIDNDSWIKEIEYYQESLKGEKAEKERLLAIDMYLTRQRQGRVPLKDLVDLYSDLAAWSRKMMNVEESEATIGQLTSLDLMCRSLVKILNNLGQDSFSQRELDKYINRIYDPQTFRISEKEKDSHIVIRHPAQLYDHADTLVWFDFHTQPLISTWYDFLTVKEIEKLTQRQVWLWERENQVEFALRQLINGILKTSGKLFLFIPKKSGGKETTPHPLMSNLISSFDNTDKHIYHFSLNTSNSNIPVFNQMALESPEEVELPGKASYISIDHQNLIKPRVKESYSSIEHLIKYPLDWVLNYQAKLIDKGFGKIEDLARIKGNLSHKVVQELLEGAKNGSIVLNALKIEEEADKLLKIYTPQYAAPLQLDQNLVEYNAFKKQLKDSIKVLLEIIEQNKLEFIEYEHRVSGKIQQTVFEGFIDLLFKMNDGTPVLVDLKWTLSDTKYYSLLTEEKSIQLAVYAKLLGGNPVTSYFLLSHGKMYTTDSRLKGKEINLITIDNPTTVHDRIIVRMMNAVRYRMSEIQEGKIESGEKMELKDLQYFHDTASKDLIPLEQDGKLKKENYYSDYGVFKGEVQ